MENRPKLILLVEDDPFLRQVLAELLRDEGFKVIPASDGQRALNWLVAAPIMPQVIITDLVMPNLDGWQLWSELHARDRWKNIPVIVLSSALHTRPWPEGMVPAQQLRKPPKLDYFLRVVTNLADTACVPSVA